MTAREQALEAALTDCLLDLDHYAHTHGPGPDRRLAAARAALAMPQDADTLRAENARLRDALKLLVWEASPLMEQYAPADRRALDAARAALDKRQP